MCSCLSSALFFLSLLFTLQRSKESEEMEKIHGSPGPGREKYSDVICAATWSFYTSLDSRPSTCPRWWKGSFIVVPHPEEDCGLIVLCAPWLWGGIYKCTCLGLKLSAALPKSWPERLKGFHFLRGQGRGKGRGVFQQEQIWNQRATAWSLGGQAGKNAGCDRSQIWDPLPASPQTLYRTWISNLTSLRLKPWIVG